MVEKQIPENFNAICDDFSALFCGQWMFGLSMIFENKRIKKH